MKAIFQFAMLRTKFHHYYQPWTEGLIRLLDGTYQDILHERDLESEKYLIAFTYEVGVNEIIPRLLSQDRNIPKSWQIIEALYKKYFPKLLKERKD